MQFFSYINCEALLKGRFFTMKKSFISNLAAFGLVSALMSGCGDSGSGTVDVPTFDDDESVADSLSQGQDSGEDGGSGGKATSSSSGKNVSSSSGGKSTSSSSNTGASSSSSSQVEIYLESSKQLNIALTGYTQKVDSLRSDKATGKVSVRFEVNTFAKGKSAGEPLVSGLYLDAFGKTSWTGRVSSGFTIASGVDSLSICPVVYDQIEATDNYTNKSLIQDLCVGIGKVGQLDESLHTEKSSNKKVRLDWNWNLFEIEE